MWRTAEGNRILEGAERRIFVLGLTCFLHELTNDGSYTFGSMMSVIKELEDSEEEYIWNDAMPQHFAVMTAKQKIVALAFVAKHLLDFKAPLYNALEPWAEATVASVYDILRIQVDLEIDSHFSCCNGHPSEIPYYTFVRNILLQFTESMDEESKEMHPQGADEGDDKSDWYMLIEDASEAILWDCDYEDDDDYCPATMPQVTAETLRKSLMYLIRLTQGTMDAWNKAADASLNAK